MERDSICGLMAGKWVPGIYTSTEEGSHSQEGQRVRSGLIVSKQHNLLLSLPILCIKAITYKGMFLLLKITYLTSTHIHTHL